MEKYNLSKTSDDIKGIAFERFLGRTFRGELGQFFTPRTVVDFMVEILDPKEGELICDPCSGSGGFLIKAFEYVRSNIDSEINLSKDQIKAQLFDENFDAASEEEKDTITKQVEDLFAELNEDINPDNKTSRISHLSNNCIFGTDANPRMARVSKMNMIMHGDGHGGVHHNDGLLNINGIFENRFDVIITNPPFGSRVAKDLKITEQDRFNPSKIIDWKKKYENYGQIVKEREEQITEKKTILSLFETGKHTGLTEVIFIERCLKLLKAGGRLGIVLPEGTLNNFQLQSVRDYFEGKAKILLITSIPQDVFMASGATVKSSLVFLKKFTNEEAKQYQLVLNKATEETDAKYQPKIDKAKEDLDALKDEFDKANTTLKEIKKEFRLKKTDETRKLELSKKLDIEELNVSDLNENYKSANRSYKNFLKEIEVEKEKTKLKLVKERFNYSVPIAEVKYAGIDSKGAECQNQLVPLKKEFQKYRIENNLWNNQVLNYTYEFNDNSIIKLLNGNKYGH